MAENLGPRQQEAYLFFVLWGGGGLMMRATDNLEFHGKAEHTLSLLLIYLIGVLLLCMGKPRLITMVVDMVLLDGAEPDLQLITLVIDFASALILRLVSGYHYLTRKVGIVSLFELLLVLAYASGGLDLVFNSITEVTGFMSATLLGLDSEYHYLMNRKIAMLSLHWLLFSVSTFGALDLVFKFFTEVKDPVSSRLNGFTSRYRCMDRKVVRVSLLGLLSLALALGALGLLVFHSSLGQTEVSDNTVFTDYDQPHGRVLLASNRYTEDKASVSKDGIISMAHWISSGQSGKDPEETTEMQKGPDKSHLHSVPKKNKIDIVFRILLGLAIFDVVCGFAVLVFCKCRKRARRNEQVQEAPVAQLELCRIMGPRRYQYQELATATDNFAGENKLGEGGFGPVYRGYMTDLNRHVAIKVLSQGSRQGQKEFEAEVKLLTQLRHKNVVQLVGWCHSNEGLLLVYELMSGGSLHKHLYDPVKTLPWQRRYNIAIDLGSALLYLHQDCDYEKSIVHGDIKPENVMLDASFNGKLGDFGVSRLVERGAEPQLTEDVKGTRGYIDPVFCDSRVRCLEADVHSFGVVLVEIACGKRPTWREENGVLFLLDWVRNLYDQRMILDAADQRLNGEFDRQQMERVLVTGLWCTHQDPSQRPSIKQAMDVLCSADATLPAIPARPDTEHIRSLEALAFGNATSEYDSALAVNATTYLTSTDSGDHLLAEE